MVIFFWKKRGPAPKWDPGPNWTQAQMGRRPKLGQAQIGPMPKSDPCPNGARPKWDLCPNGPGPHGTQAQLGRAQMGLCPKLFRDCFLVKSLSREQHKYIYASPERAAA